MMESQDNELKKIAVTLDRRYPDKQANYDRFVELLIRHTKKSNTIIRQQLTNKS